MNEEQPLPKFPFYQREFNYDFPNILIRSEGDRVELIQGGRRSIKWEFEDSFSFEEAKEEAVKIRQLNQFMFAGNTIQVLNDESNDLVASVPTASEWRALSGKRVLVSFACNPIPKKDGQYQHPSGRQVFKIHRAYIQFP